MTKPQLRPVTVGDIVQTDVVTVEEDVPVTTAVAQMNSEDVGSVIVVNDEQKPVGIVTDRKVALALEEMEDLRERTVDDLVDGEMLTGDTDMSVFDALNRLSDESIRRLPIVDEDGKLEGIVTLDDLVVLLASELNTAAEVIEAQSPRF